MRGLLLVAGLVLAFIILSPMLRGWRPRLLGGGGENRPDQLVKDPFCGTYVLRSRAFRRESGGEALHFCSADCATRFARGERPV
jgi:YHS domain-containing protein